MANEKPNALTVGELIEVLKAYPASAKVVLARDPEGNGYGLLHGHEPCSVLSERYGRVEVGSANRIATAPAVILWPLG